MSKILVIDDKTDIRELVSDILKDEGYEVIEASNASSAINKFDDLAPSVVILDIWLEGSDMDGIGLLKRFKSISPEVPIIMISGHGNIETAVQTIKFGAYDFIEKPFKAERLLLIVKRALELANLKEEIKDLKIERKKLGLLGESKSALQVMESVKLAAQTNSRVLITGESGVGKGLVARAIHCFSERSSMPYVVIHASSTNIDNSEIELFGVDDGKKSKAGKLEKASGGTIFIDEISNLSNSCQLSFLKFLQEGVFFRSGSNVPLKSDIRIICSSIHNLANLSSFNQSLFYRLNVVHIHVPSLRERKEDFESILADILSELEVVLNMPKPSLSAEVIAYLQAYKWPGNVRQLRNVLEGIMILKSRTSQEITVRDLPKDLLINSAPVLTGLKNDLILQPIKPARELFEAEYLRAQLSRFSGNISKTADFIGMDRAALHRKLKNLKIANE